MVYDIEELRDTTYRHCEDPEARIPCPDCRDRPGLAIAEDQPVMAALLSYCALCDGERSVSKARALAVLPRVVEHQQELRERIKRLLRKHGQHTSECEKHPDRLANRRTPQYNGDRKPKEPQCICGLEEAIARGVEC